jgi:hypothetical protein
MEEVAVTETRRAPWVRKPAIAPGDPPLFLRERKMSLLLAGALLIASSPAAGSHGGPDVVEPLGWDPQSETAYFRIIHENESGWRPTVVVLARDVISTHPLPVALSRSFNRDTDDQTYEAWVDSLRRSLTPLYEVPSPSLFKRSEILAADTLTGPGGRFPRYTLRVSDGRIGQFIVEGVLCSPHVVMVRCFQPPNQPVRFGVLAFRAIPWEECYEVQLPVAIISPSTPVRVRWRSWQ